MSVGVTFENTQSGLLFSGTGSRRVSVGMLVICKSAKVCLNRIIYTVLLLIKRKQSRMLFFVERRNTHNKTGNKYQHDHVNESETNA